MKSSVKRFILYIITVISAAYPFVVAMSSGYDWGEFFLELIVCFAIAFVCHTLASALKRIEELEDKNTPQDK